MIWWLAATRRSYVGLVGITASLTMPGAISELERPNSRKPSHTDFLVGRLSCPPYSVARLDAFVEAECGEIETAIPRVKETRDDFFAARRREHRDAQLDPAEFRAAGGMALLREAGLVADQIGHHFEAAGDFLHQIERQMDEFREHAAETQPHNDGVFPRLDMDIAGAGGDGVGEDMIDEHADLDALFGGVIRLKVMRGLIHGAA